MSGARRRGGASRRWKKRVRSLWRRLRRVSPRTWGRIGLVFVTFVAAVAILRWTERPPSAPDDLCEVFDERWDWYDSARRSFERWGVPESVQLAVIFRESGFRARARPPRGRLWGVIPWSRPSTAYGYAQVLDATWKQFQDEAGRPRATRTRFDDVAHFVGWYGSEIHRLTGIPKDDAYRLYLAYHEGPTGYLRGSHKAKPRLLRTARRVASRAADYERQYRGCRESLERRGFWRLLQTALLAALAWALYRWRRRSQARSPRK